MSNVFKELLAKLSQLPSTIFHYVVAFHATLFKLAQHTGTTIKVGWQHNQRRVVGSWLAVVILATFFVDNFGVVTAKASSVSTTNPSIETNILPNGAFGFSSDVYNFDIRAFLQKQAGPLKTAIAKFDTRSFSAGSIILSSSANASISPKLILTYLEVRQHLLSDATTTAKVANLAGNPKLSDFKSQLDWLLESLNTAFYSYNDSKTYSYNFLDGSTFPVPANTNPATYAILSVLASTVSNYNEWLPYATSFKTTYTTLFGTPMVKANSPNPKASNPGLKFPWTAGETWYYIGGPHNNDGSGNYPRSAIDLQAPPSYNISENCVNSVGQTPQRSTRPLLAPHSGKIVYTDNSQYYEMILDYNDGSGYQIALVHVAPTSMPTVGTIVNQGDFIGYPSDCGEAYSVHDHFSTKQNGTALPIDGTVISGWTIHQGTNAYDGTMTNGTTTLTATTSCLCATNAIVSDNNGTPPALDAQLDSITPNGITLPPGGGNNLVDVHVVNTGTETWPGEGSSNTPLRLGTINNTPSPFYLAGDDWLNNGRLKMDQTSVPPGGTATFAISLHAPAGYSPGTYQQQFQLLEENRAWFGPIITVNITVGSAGLLGSFDADDCNYIGGWAYDPNAPANTSNSVNIYDGSILIGQYPANNYRKDIQQNVSYDNGLHGFTVAVPASLKDGKSHTIHVINIRADGSASSEIGNSPKNVTCAPTYQVGQGSSFQANFQDAYNRVGGANYLGQPTDIVRWYNNDPNTNVAWQPFEYGSIFHYEGAPASAANVRAFVVHGGISNYYLSNQGGGPLGQLGIPTSDEFVPANGDFRSNFANGYIVWNNGNPTVTKWPTNDNSGWYFYGSNNAATASLIKNIAADVSIAYAWNGSGPFTQEGMNFADNWWGDWTRLVKLDGGSAYKIVLCAVGGQANLQIDNYDPVAANNSCATTYWLQSYTGYSQIVVSYDHSTGNAGVSFTLTPLGKVNVAIVGGDNQTTKVNTAFANPLQIKVTDGSGNPIPGVGLATTGPTSGAGATITNGSNVISFTDANGIVNLTASANGTPGSYQVTAFPTKMKDIIGSNLVNFPTVNFNLTNTNPYTYHLPYVANNGAGIGGNYTTNVTLQNMGSAPANFTITYYDNDGNMLATDSDNGGMLAPNTKYNAVGLASGQAGAATILSTQPLSIVVSESGTFNGQTIASSYPDINTTTGVGTNIYAPIALNHSYGAFSTGFILRNTGTSDTTVTIQYYNDYGNPAGSQTVAIKTGNAVQVLQSDAAANLPNNFSGWASITSNNGQPLAGIDVETNPSTGFVATVACTATPGKTVNIPVVFQGAFGNFVTGMQLVNPNGTPANVTVTITRKDGTVMQLSSAHTSFQMAAHSDKSFFHSTSVFPELLTANGGFVGSAIITSDQPLLTIVNQTGSVGGVNFNGSFGTLLSGAAQINMPSVFKNASAYSSGLQIVNTSSVSSTATITYYDSTGNKVYQAKLTADDGGPIKPGGSINPYQGTDSNLPNGFSGTAVITADTSGASFVVVGNISDGKIFYTYAEPN